MGKGSARRPMAITRQQWEENYDRIFGKKKEKPKMVGFDLEVVAAIKSAVTLEEGVILAQRDLQIRGEGFPESAIRDFVMKIQQDSITGRAWMNYQI